MNSFFIYLASQSPRRSQLLTQLGVEHVLLLPGAAPKAYVQRVTRLKLEAALKRLKARGLPAAPVLCSDTTVALGRTIYAKPADKDDAVRMLGDLSGRTHRVLTSVAIGNAGSRVVQACSESRVTFAALGDDEIRAYVDSGEPMGKAGAYAVQGRAAAFISRISGSYTGIMGLPLFETAQLLKSLN